MRWSIATKIFLAFASLITVFTAVLSFGTFRTQTLYTRIDALNQSIIPLSLVLSDVQNDIKSYSALLAVREPEQLRRTFQVAQRVSFLPQRFAIRIKRAVDLAHRDSLAQLAEPDRARFESLAKRLNRFDLRARTFAKQAQRFAKLVNDAEHDPRLVPKIATQQDALILSIRSLERELATMRNDLRIANDLLLQRANDYQRDNLLALLALSALALLAAIALTALILLTLRPLRALTEGAQRIARGDYTPLDTPRGSDEIAQLTHEFNSMARALQERDTALREQHAALLKSERLAAIGRMTAHVTHELRNPLSSINLNAEMIQETLRQEQLLDEPLDDQLETIIEEVDRLREITDDYLAFSRLPQPRLEPHNLREVLEQLLDFHEFEWLQMGVELHKQIDDQDFDAQLDPNQIRQALLNLIKNAIEASTPNPSIILELRHTDEGLLLAIEDDGPGVDAQTQEHLFEAFFTTKPQGTGLGLALSQQILEEHGGSLRLASPQQLSGARFELLLPHSS